MKDDYFHINEQIFYAETNVANSNDEESQDTLAFSCECLDNCSDTAKCSCLITSGGKQNYDSSMKIVTKDDPMFECKENCKCQADICTNRVVQNGPLDGLEIKSFGNKGYGLITTNSIDKGRFVCEYAGELISKEIATKRDAKDTEMNYILHIFEKFTNEEQHTWIDPTVIGNIGRYINHSCDPNLYLVPVRVDTFSPRIAMISKKYIEANEELTFDYGYSDVTGSGYEVDTVQGSVKCFCNSSNCRQYLPVHLNSMHTSSQR